LFSISGANIRLKTEQSNISRLFDMFLNNQLPGVIKKYSMEKPNSSIGMP
jgi:hypothetical protein